jgi:hypothetical protein
MGKTTTPARKVETDEAPPEPMRPSKPFLLVTAALLLAWIGFLIWMAYYSHGG